MPEPAYKRCTSCGEEKPRESFNRRAKSADGLQAVCRSCASAISRRHYEANREHRKAEARRWREENPERKQENDARWSRENPGQVLEHLRRRRENHPEVVRAYTAVNNAVRRGKLTKPDACERCREPTEKDELQAHHHDYSKPLDVEWLCQDCHTAEHHGQPE